MKLNPLIRGSARTFVLEVWPTRLSRLSYLQTEQEIAIGAANTLVERVLSLRDPRSSHYVNSLPDTMREFVTLFLDSQEEVTIETPYPSA